MRWKMFPEPPIHHILLWLIITLEIVNVQCAELKDILLNPKPDDENIRVPRDSKYSNRYGARTAPDTLNDRKIKPEESPESQTKDTIVGKRCIRCDSGYLDSRYPTNQRNRQYDDRYDYDDRRYDDRYDRYDYDDRYSRDRYDRPRDNNYYDRNRFDKDRYDRDRYRNPYDRDRYDRDRTYDRYDRDRYDDRYDRDRYGSDRRDRYNDRGIGYDNRGYDYRERYDRDGYRPQDETYRGTSGFDRNGRGYYFAGVGRPAESGNWAGGYASAWNYGGDRGKGYTDGYYRPRDDLYRGVSYLYGRPSEETTVKTNTTTEANETKQTQQGNSSG